MSPLSTSQTEADRHLLKYYRDIVKALFYCGAIGVRQLEWLVNELDLALKNEEPVIILSHCPLLAETTDEKYGLLWNHEEVSLFYRAIRMYAPSSAGIIIPRPNVVRGGVQFVVLAGGEEGRNGGRESESWSGQRRDLICSILHNPR